MGKILTVIFGAGFALLFRPTFALNFSGFRPQKVALGAPATLNPYLGDSHTARNFWHFLSPYCLRQSRGVAWRKSNKMKRYAILAFTKHRGIMSAMMMSRTFYFMMFLALTLSSQFFFFGKGVQAQTVTPMEGEQVEDVYGNLSHNRMLLVDLLANPVIVDAVRKSNIQHENTSLREILDIDKAWEESIVETVLMRQLRNNACAKLLIQFQGTNGGFAEIFVTNSKGLNVCQTNRTTDYFQADEPWWGIAFDHDTGRSRGGMPEYDLSAATAAIPIYAPIIDPDSQKAIGVTKAVISLENV